MTDYLELAWEGSAEALARALERLDAALRTGGRGEPEESGTDRPSPQEELRSPSLLEREAARTPAAEKAALDWGELDWEGPDWGGLAGGNSPNLLDLRQTAAPLEDWGAEGRGAQLPLWERTAQAQAAAEAEQALRQGEQRALGEDARQGALGSPDASWGAGAAFPALEGGGAARYGSAPAELGAARYGSAPEEGEDAPWSLPGTGRMSTEELDRAEQVDRAFRRDSRRYDGCFYLY